MVTLKTAITTAPALIQIDYSPGVGEIILMVDLSGAGWGATLNQLDKEDRRYPCRFESGIWSKGERKYDSGKLECRALLYALKKFRVWLYGAQFTVETYANTLVAQLNRSAIDLPGSLMTRWLAWIQLWDFDVRHVPGKKNSVADGLSRRPAQEGELKDKPKEDLEDFIDWELGCITCAINSTILRNEDPNVSPLDDTYSEEYQKIARWLSTLRRPQEMTAKEFKSFKRKAIKFKIENQLLFRRTSKNVPLRRVVDGEEYQKKVVQEMHDKNGHQGKEGTSQRCQHDIGGPDSMK